MTFHDISYHQATTVGTQLSHDMISKINEEALEEFASWQEYPLEEFYPISYLDAIVIKVRDSYLMRSKTCTRPSVSQMKASSTCLGLGYQD